MERASRALSAMDYLECEARCLEALSLARGQENWPYYARILMPLQESRRQRRMIAAEGIVRLGSTDLGTEPATWLRHFPPPAGGCMVVTRPHLPETAASFVRLARGQRRFIEVLYADNAASEPDWTLRSYSGPDVRSAVGAPTADLVDRWISRSEKQSIAPPGTGAHVPRVDQTVSATDWFLDACEGLGDTALARIDSKLKGAQRVEALEHCLQVVLDHEILHQRLGNAARDAGKGG